ncbi:MAG: NERD domain-containing protein [Ktedonobacteraceae bacterium]|nr:NERD domain-containing protein [Ktedonobacteraceae bacterium]
MSMVNRFARALETRANVELDDRDRGGMLGEDHVERIIAKYVDEGRNGCYIRNPLIPHPRKPGRFLETDFLVYTRGTLYCVETKNYQGKVYYPVRYRTVYVEKGWFIFKRRVTQTVLDGYDYSQMIQEKREPNGQITKITKPNPFLTTKRYIEDLKPHLYRIEPRLATLPVYPVLVFLEKTDMSAIHQFDAGILQISQLPAFFEKYSNPAFARTPTLWVQQALSMLSTWDRILTTDNDWINGTITDRDFCYKDTNGCTHCIPYASIRELELRREGTFSAYDDLIVTYVNGNTHALRCTGGEIHLERFKGEQQVHKLRNVSRVIVGVANKSQ